MATFNDIRKALSATGQEVVQKTRESAEISRLRGELEQNGKKLQALFQSIGEECFHAFQNDAGAMAALPAQTAARMRDVQKIYEANNSICLQIQRLRGTRKCPKCGTEIQQSGAKFCNQCGALLEVPAAPSSQFCMFCGKQLEENSRFCVFCGKPVAGLAEPSPAPDTASDLFSDLDIPDFDVDAILHSQAATERQEG